MFERVLNTLLQLYLFHALIFKNLKISHKETNLQIYSLTQNIFRLIIYAIYFPLKLFHHLYASFYQEVPRFIKRKLDLLS